jgi:hypothetical protein
MFDELDHLREDPRLAALLSHYAEKGVADREAWQDRVMELDGVAAEGLVKLHGSLLAYDWIEQNTGTTTALPGGGLPHCYRITAAGRRALRTAWLRRDADEAA